ncbi:MAG: hypothetical protein EHM37_16640, partial [Deltaproteobacteria bacterium]
YQHPDLPKLANPTNDAEDMARALRGFGFEVIERKNQTLEGMNRAISEFGSKIGGSEVALFYYAGHGIQVKNQNYLIPVNARIESEASVPYQGVNLNQVLDEMDNGKSGANIVMLDACRNNPITGKFRSGQSRGLASPGSAPKGTVIVYATDPGNVASDGTGRNGLFTAGLLTAFKGKDLTLDGVLTAASAEVEKASGQTQTPYVNGPKTLQKSFHFHVTVEPGPGEIEKTFWTSIERSNDVADFEAYLQKYPAGSYKALAENRLKKLKADQQASSAPSLTAPSAVSSAGSSTAFDGHWAVTLVCEDAADSGKVAKGYTEVTRYRRRVNTGFLTHGNLRGRIERQPPQRTLTPGSLCVKFKSAKRHGLPESNRHQPKVSLSTVLFGAGCWTVTGSDPSRSLDDCCRFQYTTQAGNVMVQSQGDPFMANPEHLKLLMQGVGVWNRWRKRQPGIKPDLSLAKLAGITPDYNLNLSEADLSGADLSDAKLVMANLTRANLLKADLCKTDLSTATLAGTTLSKAFLFGAKLTDADLTKANLSKATLSKANLAGANLSRATLIGANLFEANLWEANLEKANFTQANLSGTNLTEANLSGAVFHQCHIGYTSFVNVNLNGVQDLETVKHVGPSHVAISTIFNSGGDVP